MLVFLLALLHSPALAAPSEPLDEADYRGMLDQARFQIRREFWDQAERDLVRATQHPDGTNDAEAWFLLAQVRYQRSDLLGARAAAEHALTNARTEEQQAQIRAILEFLQTDFALLSVSSAQPGLRWHPQIEAATPLFDPEQQAWVERLAKRLRKERPLLPTTIGLPAGSWIVNGEALDLEAGGRAKLSLGMRAAGGGMASARLAWLEIAAGVSLGLGEGEHLLPSPTSQLALTLPVGGIWALGVVGQHVAVATRAEDGVYRFDPRGLSGGLRFGPLLDDGERLLFRPSIGYRYGGLAGVRRTCARGEAWTCGEGTAERIVYVSGTAHFVVAELALDYLDRRRTSGVGGGVKLVGEQALGRLGESIALRPASEGSVQIDSSARAVSRTSIQLLANLSIAF